MLDLVMIFRPLMLINFAMEYCVCLPATIAYYQELIGRVLRTLDTMLYTEVLIVVLFELDHYYDFKPLF